MLKQAGWLLALIADESGTDTWRVPAANLGVPVVPWLQVRNPSDVAYLVDEADEWGSPGLIVNVEKQSETTCRPSQIAAELTAWHRDAAILTSPYAEPSAGWQPVTKYVTASEAYMNANKAFTPNMVYDHLASLKFPRALACWGVGQWGDATLPHSPAEYKANDRSPEKPHWIWTIDQLSPGELATWLT